MSELLSRYPTFWEDMIMFAVAFWAVGGFLIAMLSEKEQPPRNKFFFAMYVILHGPIMWFIFLIIAIKYHYDRAKARKA